MRQRTQLSILITLGLLTAGSTALGYYYYYVYSPPLVVAEAFMDAMERRDAIALTGLIRISQTRNSVDLREPSAAEVARLLRPRFRRGRILDQHKREGPERTFHYLVYREPDGQVYALVIGEHDEGYHVVIPEEPASTPHWYLQDYTWTN
jgi:hypothetical protein